MLNFDNRHYYDILKVGNHATRKEITASYSQLVKEHNPDGKSFSSQSLKQKAQEQFKLIDEAYQALSNPIKRAEYDAFLDEPFCEEDVAEVVDVDVDVDVDTKTKEESCDDETNKTIINCPKCDQRLRVLSGESLSVSCSSCSHTFDYQGKSQEYQPEDSHETPKTQPKDTKAETPTSENRESTSRNYEKRKNVNYFRKHWRGELSLAISFWVNVVLVNIIFMSLLTWFAEGSPISHPVISARVTIIIVFFCLSIYAWQIVGLWRSCNRNILINGKAFWARTTQVIVVLCFLGNLGNIFSSFGLYKDLYQLGFQKDTTSACSLTLRKNNSLIHLEGGLRFGVSKDVAALLNNHPDIKGIILDCDGGRVYEAKEISKLILIYGLDTYTLKGCYSAGTIAFISGTNRFLGTGANLGFHQYSMDYKNLADVVDLSKEQKEDLRIFKRKGIKEEFLEKLYNTSAEDLWYPSVDELLGAGVIHGTVNPSDLMPVAYEESIKDINIKEILLDIPVYRTLQKYESDVFEQIISDMNEHFKKGATLLEMQASGANRIWILANRLLPMSSDETLTRFGQILVDILRKLVETDPILCLRFIYPEQYGAFVYSRYISDDKMESLNEVLRDIIIDAHEKENPQIDVEAAELQMQEIVLALGDDVEYVDIDLKKLQNSDQYKRHCDALIRIYELILANNKINAGNILRYMFSQDESDASVYDGNIIDGKKHGYGTYTFDGSKYVGEFKDDMADGQGTITWSDGNKYVGEWKDNKRHGTGTVTYADGSEYVGEFRNGNVEGQGKHSWPDGEKYVGEWKASQRHGHGTSTQPDGEKYAGEWKYDMKSGQGTNTWPDGERYVGEWKDNNPIGGWYYLANGNRNWAYTDEQGNWKYQEEDNSGVENSENYKVK